MKTQNTNLAFRKDAVVELNEDLMNEVVGGGGSHWWCPGCLLDKLVTAFE